MERQIQRKEEINKFVEKLLDKIVIKAKEMAVANARVIKFLFTVEGIFLTTENAQQQEKMS